MRHYRYTPLPGLHLQVTAASIPTALWLLNRDILRRSLSAVRFPTAYDLVEVEG